MNKRMDRSKLNIGAYFLDEYACTEEHIKAVKDCGIDFIVCMEDIREALDLFQKYEIGAIVSHIVPFWWSARQTEPPGTMAENNPIDDYEKSAKGFTDHPAIWGIDCGDEPSALDFEHYGKVLECVNTKFPNQFGYVNLYPNYAMVAANDAEKTKSQLGVPTYDEYIAEYCKYVPTDYICYDFYVYATSVSRMYKNYISIADACRDTGRAMWIVLQLNSDKEEIYLTENNLRFQAYTAMAFGAENIIWACCTAGWWHHQIFDREGKKTEQYEKVKNVNAEIKAISDAYMKYRRTSTYFLGFGSDNPEIEGIPYDSYDVVNTGYFKDIRSDASVLVSDMVSRDATGRHAMFFAATNDWKDENPAHCTVTFNAVGHKLSLVATDSSAMLSNNGDGSYSLILNSNSAAIITEEWE